MKIYTKFGNSYGTIADALARKVTKGNRLMRTSGVSRSSQGEGMNTIFSKMSPEMISGTLKRTANSALDNVAGVLEAYSSISEEVFEQLVPNEPKFQLVPGLLDGLVPVEGVPSWREYLSSSFNDTSVPASKFTGAAFVELLEGGEYAVSTRQVGAYNITGSLEGSMAWSNDEYPMSRGLGVSLFMTIKLSRLTSNNVGLVLVRCYTSKDLSTYCDLPLSITPYSQNGNYLGINMSVFDYYAAESLGLSDLADESELAYAPDIDYHVFSPSDPGQENNAVIRVDLLPDIAAIYGVSIRYTSSGVMGVPTMAAAYSSDLMRFADLPDSSVYVPAMTQNALEMLSQSTELRSAGRYSTVSGATIQLGCRKLDTSSYQLIMSTRLGLTFITYQVENNITRATSAYYVVEGENITTFPPSNQPLVWSGSDGMPVDLDMLIQDITSSYDVKHIVSLALDYLGNPNVDSAMLHNALTGLVNTKSPAAADAANKMLTALIATDKQGVAEIVKDMVIEAEGGQSDTMGNITYGEAPYTVSGFLSGLGSTLLSVGSTALGVALSIVSPVLGIVWTAGASLISGIVGAVNSTTLVGINEAAVLKSFNVSILRGEVIDFSSPIYSSLDVMIQEFGVAIVLGPGFVTFYWPSFFAAGDLGRYDSIKYETFITADFSVMPKVQGLTDGGISEVDYVRFYDYGIAGYEISADGKSYSLKTNPSLNGSPYKALSIQPLICPPALNGRAIDQFDVLMRQMDPGLSELISAVSDSEVDGVARKYFGLNLVIALAFIGTNYGTQGFFGDFNSSSYYHVGYDFKPIKQHGVYGVNTGFKIAETDTHFPDAEVPRSALICLYLSSIFDACTGSAGFGNSWDTMLRVLKTYDDRWSRTNIDMFVLYNGTVYNEVLGIYPWTRVTTGDALWLLQQSYGSSIPATVEAVGLAIVSGSPTVKASPMFTIPKMSKRAYIMGAVTAALVTAAITVSAVVTKKAVNNLISRKLTDKQAAMTEAKAKYNQTKSKEDFKAYNKASKSYNRWCKWTGRTTINPMVNSATAVNNTAPNGDSGTESVLDTALATALGVETVSQTPDGEVVDEVVESPITLPGIRDEVAAVGAAVAVVDVATAALIRADNKARSRKGISGSFTNGNW